MSGVISLAGSIFLQLYEGSYGTDYYLEKYGEGLFSNFNGMVAMCKWLGFILIILGCIVWVFGKKTEGPKLKELQDCRNKKLDERIIALHGVAPGMELE
ncbi:hypothetical protein [Anaerotignum sp.]|uniref:hypothetical protein n=1 Tax=Anaerotignum sp. TaxID=2039241 RepID=UPI00289DE2F8|nr:hypothetical protein [Anaerotignum sp.]